MGRRLLMTSAVLIFVSCASAQRSEEEHHFPDANDPAYAASFNGYRDPRVSTSPGTKGGVVVLWPRVIPGEGADGVAMEAATLQRRLREIATNTLAERELDVRPEPQRVCPDSGCEGIAVGAVLVHNGGGCAAVATVARPGEGATRLIAWSSGVQIRNTLIPFREPPESYIRVLDYTPCSELIAGLEERDEAIVNVLRLTSEADPLPSASEEGQEEGSERAAPDEGQEEAAGGSTPDEDQEEAADQ